VSSEYDPQTSSEDVARLREMTDRMIEALTSPPYVEAMRAVRASPEDDRLAEAERRLSPDALRDLGVPIPEGMRISSRYFEKGLPEPVEVGDFGEQGGELPEDLTTALAFGGCTCGGSHVGPLGLGPTVCGGAGVVF
jgi:hypothetical protein